MKKNKQGLIFFLSFGILYCFLIKNGITLSYSNQDLIYIICNPSIDEEVWYLSAISYYFLLDILSVYWVNSINEFLLSIKVIKKIKVVLGAIRLNFRKKISFIFLFILFALVLIDIVAFYGCYINKDCHIFASIIFIFYLLVILIIYTIKKLKKIDVRVN